MRKERVTALGLNLSPAHSPVTCAHSQQRPLVPQAFGKSLLMN